jgi:hypothetical protein
MNYNAYRTYRERHSEHLWQEFTQTLQEFRDLNPDDWRRPVNVEWYVQRVALDPADNKAQCDLRVVLDKSSIALNFAAFSYLERFFDDLTLSQFLAWGRDDNA